MWKCALLWTAITSFIISSASHTFQDYDSPISRRHLESQWVQDPFTQRSAMDLNSFLDEDSSETLNAGEEDLLESMPQKKNREGHSLSIVNPLDVLRQRLMLEMARRRMKENQEQIRENAVILKNLGKRSKTNKGGSKTNQDYHKRLQISSSEDLEV